MANAKNPSLTEQNERSYTTIINGIKMKNGPYVRQRTLE